MYSFITMCVHNIMYSFITMCVHNIMDTFIAKWAHNHTIRFKIKDIMYSFVTMCVHNRNIMSYIPIVFLCVLIMTKALN